MEKTQISSTRRSFNFRLGCDAGNTGKFQAEGDSAWLRIAQRIRRSGKEEMWDSVTIECTSEQDGTLVLRVIVFNPDWEEPLQIASIRSRPQDIESLTPLGCNLAHNKFATNRDLAGIHEVTAVFFSSDGLALRLADAISQSVAHLCKRT